MYKNCTLTAHTLRRTNNTAMNRRILPTLETLHSNSLLPHKQLSMSNRNPSLCKRKVRQVHKIEGQSPVMKLIIMGIRDLHRMHTEIYCDSVTDI